MEGVEPSSSITPTPLSTLALFHLELHVLWFFSGWGIWPSVGGRTPFTNTKLVFHRLRSMTVLSSVSASALEAHLTRTAAVVAAVAEWLLASSPARWTRFRTWVAHVATRSTWHEISTSFLKEKSWPHLCSWRARYRISSVNKSVYYNNTNYKKMQQYIRIIFIFRPPEGLFRIATFPYNPPNSQKYPADLTWWFSAK